MNLDMLGKCLQVDKHFVKQLFFKPLVSPINSSKREVFHNEIIKAKAYIIKTKASSIKLPQSQAYAPLKIFLNLSLYLFLGA